MYNYLMNTHQIKMSKLLGGKVNKYSKAQIKGSEFHDMFRSVYGFLMV